MALAFTDNFILPQDWQLGKSLSESTVCLWRAGKHADVWFRCKDQDETVKTDRIAAHKLILACRSPVFEAMLYGELAETSEEISLPETEKIPFLLFLRYLYTDTTDLSEEHAIDVMRIAHKYQVTTCLEYCSKFLEEILRPDNACCILDNALLLEDKDLKHATIDFIDDHASAVLESEGFTHISQGALEYILRGNTFFAPEVDIIKAVDDWATKRLESKDLEMNPANKRTVIGGAFYHLRLPALPLRDFVASQLKYGYLTGDEEKDIARCIIEKSETNHHLCMSSESRQPREVTYFMSVLKGGEAKEPTLGQILGNEVHLTCTKQIQLKEILFSLKLKSLAHAKCCIERSTDNKKVVIKEALLQTSNSNFTLSPAISLHTSGSPYKITVSVTPREDSGDINSGSALSPVAFGSISPPHKTRMRKAGGFGFGANSTTSASGFSFSSGISVSVPIPQQRSTSTQTEEDTDHDQPMKHAASVLLDTSDGRNCFIQGIRYTNKSNRR